MKIHLGKHTHVLFPPTLMQKHTSELCSHYRVQVKGEAAFQFLVTMEIFRETFSAEENSFFILVRSLRDTSEHVTETYGRKVRVFDECTRTTISVFKILRWCDCDISSKSQLFIIVT